MTRTYLRDAYGVVHEPLPLKDGAWAPVCRVRDGLGTTPGGCYWANDFVAGHITCVRCAVGPNQRRYFP